ncbi:hypothetical protein LCGC14_0549800 [marine sediment metagenome]|uniref:Molybdenum carrier n=1 Tax=marine sediment metagenome TaxID=412755 RepID=A0A0F9UYI1_9ZZZZ
MKIISGGQTGVDRAALDFAREQGMETGGWAPKGWMTTNGSDLSLKNLGLKEHTGGYRERTIENIKEADATLILAFNMKSFGTQLTINQVKQRKKPYLTIELSNPNPEEVMNWIRSVEPQILNVAGNRQTSNVDIYRVAKVFLLEVFVRLTVRRSALLRDLKNR